MNSRADATRIDEEQAPAALILRLEKIWKSYGETSVLSDVNLNVSRGEVVCIIGPSGAGKSTLLRCINNLETIDSGSIIFEGMPVYRYQRNGRTIIDPEAKVAGIRARSGWCSSPSTCSRT